MTGTIVRLMVTAVLVALTVINWRMIEQNERLLMENARVQGVVTTLQYLNTPKAQGAYQP